MPNATHIVIPSSSSFNSQGAPIWSFQGLWETTWGQIEFRQNNGSVEGLGTYKFNGTVTGNRLDASYHGPMESGTVVFTLSDDGLYFKGTYSGSLGQGPWDGRRLGTPIALTPARENANAKRDQTSQTTIHVAYPKGGEQIADERVTLLGYVTCAHKTQSVKLFVNRQRQFIDELWRVSPIETHGLRGYPLDFLVPIEPGKNIIEIRVLDQEGFMVNHVVEVDRIEIAETRVASSASLAERLPDLALEPQNQAVNEQNFAVVIEDWVKQTAISDFNKGNRMYDAGRLERAAYYYRKAIQTNPLTPALFNLGLTLKGLGNENDAQQALEQACQQNEQRACDMVSDEKGLSLVRAPAEETPSPTADAGWVTERERLTRERRELERLKLEIERKRLEGERKRLEAEIQKMAVGAIAPVAELKIKFKVNRIIMARHHDYVLKLNGETIWKDSLIEYDGIIVTKKITHGTYNLSLYSEHLKNRLEKVEKTIEITGDRTIYINVNKSSLNGSETVSID